MAKAGKGANFILGILIGLLFICIGVEGIGNMGDNALYRAIDNEIWNIIMGIVILVAGLLLLAQTLGLGRLPKTFSLVAELVVVVIWVLVIIFADFVYGVKHTNGSEWVVWLENFIYHVLILSCVAIVCFPSLKKAAGKIQK